MILNNPAAIFDFRSSINYKWNERYVLILIVFLCYSNVYGQYGIRGAYTINSYDRWNDVSEDFSPHHYEIGLNYWFRLKSQRIEFLPEFLYGLGSKTEYTYLSEDYSYKHDYAEIRLTTQFYLFDFNEDCNCPTFSKQGPSFLKGFYAQLSPGLRMAFRKSTFLIGSSFNTHIHPTLHAGLGIDIGLTDFITISPNAAIGLNFKDRIENKNFTDLDINEDSWSSLLFSVRMLFRFDYLNTPSWKR